MRQTAIPTFVIVLLGFLLTPEVAYAQGNWSERISFKGDFRLRYEGIDEEFEANRDRMRFRGRLGLAADVNEDIKFVFQLATGGSNPVSTNQSLDGGFSTKDIGVDLAYVDWTFSESINILAGKIKNPLFRAGGAPLLWDGDLNLEGVAATYSAGGLFATAGGYSVEERSSVDDSLLFAVQGGYKFPLSDGMTLTAGAGYLTYTNTVGNTPFFNGRANGNTVDVSGNYVNDYANVELFAELGMKVNDWPLKVFAQLVNNTKVSSQDQAFAVGAKVGSAKDSGQSEFSWTYQDTEADAVVGTFNDSDFGGGATDSDGHIVRAKYAYNNNVFLGGTLFINKVDRVQGVEHDYSRIQIDLEFKFN